MFNMWLVVYLVILCGTLIPVCLSQIQEEIPRDLPPAPEFTIYDERDMPCVLVLMDATIEIQPKRTVNQKYTVTIPVHAEATGDCGQGEDSGIIITWNSFRLLWHFQKSPVSDAWYIDAIEFSYNTSDKVFGTDAKKPGSVKVIHSNDPLTLYLTPVGRSYQCTLPKEIKLMGEKKTTKVVITLNRVKIQPFAYMTRRQYGKAFQCPEQAGRKSETIPFAIGGILALAVLGTISGYAGFRYMKVKKIEYDTME